MHRRKNRSASDQSLRMERKAFSTPVMYDQAVDKKTKQKLFFECHACILGQERLETVEKFCQNKAAVLMNRLYGKRQAHCFLYCLEDNIRFERTKILGQHPKRNFVRYSSIKHVFLFEDKPDAMILCIDSGRESKRFYEAYKFKAKGDLMVVCDMIYKATEDPEYILRDLPVIREVSRLSASSIPTIVNSEIAQPGRNASSLSTIRPISSTDIPMSYSPVCEESRQYATWNSSKPVMAAPVTSRPMTSYISVKKWHGIISNENLSAEELHREMCKRMNDGDWVVDLTYLRWDYHRGAVIDDHGPIYMYVARQIQHH